MNVLLLGPYPPPYGGVQTNLLAIRELLRARGTPCRVVNLTRYRQAEGAGIYFPESALAVVRLLVRLPGDIIHVHIGGDISTRLLLLLLFCSLLPRAKTVLTLHSGGYPGSEAGRSSHPGTFRARVFQRLDALIAVNRELVELFVQKFGVRRERVHLIEPHSLPAETASDEDLSAPVREFLSSRKPVFLSMGWLEPEYDYPLQIEAIARLRQQHPNAGLMIFGSGRLEGELKARILRSGCEDAVLLAGDVPHPAALRAMERSDVFLRTTHYDGDSISVREALHLGVPVVATDNGMRPEGVILTPVGSLEGLLEASAKALSMPRQSVGRAPDTRNIEAVCRLYESLLQS